MIGSVSVAIVAHPNRLQMADDLAAATNAEAILVDDQQLGCKGNHIRAWEWLQDSNTEWGVALEDDAVPVPDFRTQLSAALRQAPSPIVSLYLGRGRPPGMAGAISRVIARDVCWVNSIYCLHGVGLALRTLMIPDMLSWVKDVDLPIDEAVSQWASQNHFEISYSRPSLVNHADVPTVMKSHPTGYSEGDVVARTELRQAWLHGGRDHWDSSVIAM